LPFDLNTKGLVTKSAANIGFCTSVTGKTNISQLACWRAIQQRVLTDLILFSQPVQALHVTPKGDSHT
jgi:hypothetical protein